ncbi:MAG: lysylphosphatidylglycerol synthase transmembrane domain-containing protein, partial [Mycobacteriales bacterium]
MTTDARSQRHAHRGHAVVANLTDRTTRAAQSLWIRALVTCALLAGIATQVDWSSAGHRVANGRPAWFIVGVLLLVVAEFVGGARWHVLLHGAEVDAPRGQTLRAYLIGVFTNNFLPTSFGGDVTRAWIVSRSRGTLVRALTSVAFDRATAIWCLVGVAWGALATDPGAIPRSLVLALLAMTLGGIVATTVVLRLVATTGTWDAGWVPARVRQWTLEARETLQLYVQSPGVVVRASMLGVVYQLVAVGSVLTLAMSINLDLAFSLVAITSPLVLVITLVPISIAGFGV